MALGSLAIASLAGMAWRIGENFVPGGAVIKLVSNVVVGLTLITLAFSVLFSQLSLDLLTSNIWLAVVFFVSIGYAAAGIIADTIGM